MSTVTMVARDEVRPHFDSALDGSADTLPLSALLPQLPAAIRAVQDHLKRAVRRKAGPLLRIQLMAPCGEVRQSTEAGVRVELPKTPAARASGAAPNGTSCWQIVPRAGSVSVSTYALTALSMQGELPP